MCLGAPSIPQHFFLVSRFQLRLQTLLNIKTHSQILHLRHMQITRYNFVHRSMYRQEGIYVLPRRLGNFTYRQPPLVHRNVEVSVNGVTRAATATPSAVEDGVAIVGESSGNILVTLNSSSGFSANDVVSIRLGTHTTNASSTIDTGILNPATLGTKSIGIEIGGGAHIGNAAALVAIVHQGQWGLQIPLKISHPFGLMEHHRVSLQVR
jgi:hypothetical protein